MNKLMMIFKAPTAEQLAHAQLARAKRDLLAADAQREQAVLVADYQRGLIARLNRVIASGELV